MTGYIMESHTIPTKVKSKKVSRYFYLIFGFIFVGIGVLGIFLPLLPTAIFLIMASICFMKSSPKLAVWLKNNKLLGGYVRNYFDKTGLTLTSKVIHIFVLWVSIGLSAYFIVEETAIRILLLIIAISVSIHLIMIKTART
jgi:uncharacterized membrane protein YbaN (DUF454 family)